MLAAGQTLGIGGVGGQLAAQHLSKFIGFAWVLAAAAGQGLFPLSFEAALRSMA